ncbi:hypothetical protein [Leptolyngbya sp. FACHB-261]|uniref:hypothetical protein n=1 Tax=Leptolyngbya sp. FACHB-261 TaxID=2692806 RepID=UPI0016848126|nr:hypothetical protein [Leptolyngbya sp. FACHB-261]MBD2102290.1 hypothetical protein [Leptolyngbya sp. FACHB-261]
MRTRFLALIGTVAALVTAGGAAVAQSTAPAGGEIQLSREGREILCQRFPLNSRCPGGSTGAVSNRTAPAAAGAVTTPSDPNNDPSGPSGNPAIPYPSRNGPESLNPEGNTPGASGSSASGTSSRSQACVAPQGSSSSMSGMSNRNSGMSSGSMSNSGSSPRGAASTEPLSQRSTTEVLEDSSELRVQPGDQQASDSRASSNRTSGSTSGNMTGSMARGASSNNSPRGAASTDTVGERSTAEILQDTSELRVQPGDQQAGTGQEACEPPTGGQSGRSTTPGSSSNQPNGVNGNNAAPGGAYAPTNGAGGNRQ